jgi:hypothetical protein
MTSQSFCLPTTPRSTSLSTSRVAAFITAISAVISAVLATTHVNAATCAATSTAVAPTVIELYTSEGCDSCPPADRWLSKFVASGVGADVIALAFHVDYWDYIGWKDEFAKPAYGTRHSALAKSAKASGVYTPQLFVNGREERGWSVGNAPRPSAAVARAWISLTAAWQNDALTFTGMLKGADGKTAPASGTRLRYAVTESGLATDVKAGENRGVMLKHDAVVRDHGALMATADGAFNATAKLASGVRRKQTQLYVIAEAANGDALAAASLRCE